VVGTLVETAVFEAERTALVKAYNEGISNELATYPRFSTPHLQLMRTALVSGRKRDEVPTPVSHLFVCPAVR
jgi:hypothetical protein